MLFLEEDLADTFGPSVPTRWLGLALSVKKEWCHSVLYLFGPMRVLFLILRHVSMSVCISIL